MKPQSYAEKNLNLLRRDAQRKDFAKLCENLRGTLRFIFLGNAIFFVLMIFGCHSPGKKNVAQDSLKKKHHLDSFPKYKRDESEFVFDTLDDTLLLGRLFDRPQFDSTKTAIWKPNYSERSVFSLSYDGRCHTRIDTIMYFTDHQKRKCAAVILATYRYGKDILDSAIEIGDCHFCGVPIGIALLSQRDDGKWELYQYKKAFTTLGYFGEYNTKWSDAGKIRLKELGDRWTCLSLVQGVGGNSGEFTGTEYIYSIEQYEIGGWPNNVLSNIFTYNYDYSLASIDGNGKLIVKEIATMKIQKKKDDYYDIDLITTRNDTTTTGHYVYSDDYSQYVLKK